MQGLPRIYEVREPKHLPAGAVKIGEQQHEVLEIIRAKVQVRVIITPTYKCNGEQGQTVIVSEPPPPRPLPKCLAGPGLLAQVLVDKFCDHLPVNRQVSRFERDGLSIPYNTLLDWSAKSIDLISVLHEAQKKALLCSPYIHVD
jgi:transposase